MYFESRVAQFLRFISIEFIYLSKTTFSKRISLKVMKPMKNRMAIGIHKILYLEISKMRVSFAFLSTQPMVLASQTGSE